MKKIIFYFLVLMVLMSSCVLRNTEKKETPEIALQKLGINGRSDFSLLDACQQVGIYSIVGAKFLDIDHASVLVPNWMFEEISKYPVDVIVECVADQGKGLISELSNAVTIESESVSLRIHALIYLSNDLGLLMDPEIKQFVLSAICNKHLYSRGSLAMIYYVADGQDVYSFRDPTDIIEYYCK